MTFSDSAEKVSSDAAEYNKIALWLKTFGNTSRLKKQAKIIYDNH
jgi:hypothetical protein